MSLLLNKKKSCFNIDIPNFWSRLEILQRRHWRIVEGFALGFLYRRWQPRNSEHVQPIAVKLIKIKKINKQIKLKYENGGGLLGNRIRNDNQKVSNHSSSKSLWYASRHSNAFRHTPLVGRLLDLLVAVMDRFDCCHNPKHEHHRWYNHGNIPNLCQFFEVQTNSLFHTSAIFEFFKFHNFEMFKISKRQTLTWASSAAGGFWLSSTSSSMSAVTRRQTRPSAQHV